MIKLYWIYVNIPFSGDLISKIIKKISICDLERVLEYRRWQDAQNYLLGRMLLVYSMSDFALNETFVGTLNFNVYGRPFISDKFDFNISHSGNFVGCACSNVSKIGLDIELISQNDLSEITSMLSIEELEKVLEAANPGNEIIKYWTIKEAIVKAHGKGLLIPWNDIIIHKDGGSIYETPWYTKCVDIDQGCVAHVASDKKFNDDIIVEKISLEKLLERILS